MADTTDTSDLSPQGTPKPDGWIHRRRIRIVHPDGQVCAHNLTDGREECNEAGPRIRQGHCDCSPAAVTVLPHYTAVKAWRAKHPTADEAREAAARAAWLDEPGPVDADVWDRLRAGLRTALGEAAEASQDADVSELEDLGDAAKHAQGAIMADVFAAGYMAALADVRNLPVARDEIVMWAMDVPAEPGSMLAPMKDAAREASSDGYIWH